MRPVCAVLVATVLLAAGRPAAQRVEVLTASSALPAHVVGQFRSPAAFQRDAHGDFFVFDRSGHTVYRIDARTETPAKVVGIGPERGRILEASFFMVGGDDRFVVADAPNRQERVQIFRTDGERLGGFTLPGRAAPRVRVDSVVLSGVGSMHYTGRTLFMSQPETGGLVTEFSLSGWPLRTFGTLRPTRHEDDRDVHLALNSGLPLAAPDGAVYFVFHAGVPVFRKYDAGGTLLLERHVEGPELDQWIAGLPTSWPERETPEGQLLPLIPPTVRTAAVDPDGNLWIALSVPFTYVYDPSGEKIRTVQFKAAGLVTPDSLFFDGRGGLLVTPGCYIFDVG